MLAAIPTDKYGVATRGSNTYLWLHCTAIGDVLLGKHLRMHGTPNIEVDAPQHLKNTSGFTSFSQERGSEATVDMSLARLQLKAVEMLYGL